MTSRETIRAEILTVTGIVSFCSLVYQMSIASSFVMMTGDNILWQSITIAVYLASMGAGTYAVSRRQEEEPWGIFFRVEALLCACGAVAIAGILGMETLYRYYYHFLRDFRAPASVAPYVATLVASHLWTVLIGFLSGFEIPLMIRLYGTESEDGIAMVMGVNYLGAVAGGLAFSFVLLPVLGPLRTALVASALNLAVCAWMLRRWVVAATPRCACALAAVGGLLVSVGLVSGPLMRLFGASFYANELGAVSEFRREMLDSHPQLPWRRALTRLRALAGSVEGIQSRIQRIDLVTDRRPPSPLEIHYNARLAEEPDLPAGFSLYLNRRYQLRGATESLYHEFMTHVPVQLFRRVPRDVLILGGGDGLLARELLKYGDRIRTITNVELDPKMIELARTDPRFRRLNGGSYDDPKVRIVIDDAFFYVRNSRETYDAVYIDLPYPDHYDLTRLYSVEFFTNVGRLIRPGGWATLDFPLKPQRDETPLQEYRDNSILFNTLKAAGYRTLVPYGTEAPELVAAERASELGIVPTDYDPEVGRLQRRIETIRFLRRFPRYQPPKGRGDYVAIDNMARSETFVAFTREDRWPDFRFKDLGIRLYSLTPRRMRVLKFLRFSYVDDPALINTTLRPLLLKPHHLWDFI